ncbi:hypothetical protein PPERSA_09308 [Pseudocohnilembus persalinus]|uniref:Uncharacterized protein n=1 Tax=Pseudocohnilembus persalinus TaxID=266149 RepID=A0A0V0R573_PSEPJ|nr:hypothetical protein PPERSA_09308 [Pseudocohnilembus persalinus]|eukprot:KRX09638.1 hypothetical protein PPERSA_09308 [Pseudocohnilembus persalinus]
MKQQTSESSCDLENQLKQSVQDIQVLERQHFQEQDQIMSDHEVYVKNMLVDFQMRYDALNNRLKQVKLQKNEMEDKANMIQENMMKSQIDHFEQYRNLKGKLGDEERRKYDENLKQLEQRLAVAKELKEKTIRKNEDLLKEIEYKEKKVYEQISDSFGHGYQVEINNLREKINNLHKELSVYNLDIDGHKYKHIQIESKIDFLEEELAEKNRDLMRLKDYNRDQIDFKNVQHNYQRRGYKDSTEQLHRRICDLDNALRLQNKENEAIKTEYDRICHTLQHSINRCLAETLSSRSIVDIKNKPMELPKPPLMPAQLNQQSLPPINRLPNPSKERREPHFHPQTQHHQQQQNYQEIHQYSAPRQQQQAPIEVRPLRHSFSTLQQPLQQQTIIEHRQPINQQIIHHNHNDNNRQLYQQQHGFSLSPGRRQQQQYLVQPQFQQHQQMVRSQSPRQVFTQQGNQVIKSQSPVILSPNQYQQQQQQVIIRRSLSPTQVAGQPSQIIRRVSPTQQIGNVVQQPMQRVINSSVSPSGRKTSSLVRQLQQQQSPTILRSPIQQGVQRSSQQQQVHQQVQQTQNREQQNQEQNQQQNQNQNQHQEN